MSTMSSSPDASPDSRRVKRIVRKEISKAMNDGGRYLITQSGRFGKLASPPTEQVKSGLAHGQNLPAVQRNLYMIFRIWTKREVSVNPMVAAESKTK